MARLRTLLTALKTGQSGQGLAEYCLITAALALVGLGIYLRACGGIEGMLGR